MLPEERLAKYKQNYRRPFEVQDKVYLRPGQAHEGVARGVTGIVQEVIEPRAADIYSVTFSGTHAQPSKTIRISGQHLLLCRPSAKRLFSSSGSLPNITEALGPDEAPEEIILTGLEPATKKK